MPSNIPGYLPPSSTQGLPGGLTLTQFIQSVLVGISGFTGSLVRPKWQLNPPKQPDVTVDWIAFGIQVVTPDQFAYNWLDEHDADNLIRQQSIEVQIAFYGPNAQENITALMDGFQIQQNLAGLRSANMGYGYISPAVRGPDLVNERWVERYEMSLFLTRQVQRTYPILSFVAAAGIIHTKVDGDAEQLSQAWQTPEA